MYIAHNYNMKRHQLGQYFTTHESLKDHVFRLIKNRPGLILEPSMGRGDLVAHLRRVPADLWESLHRFQVGRH